MQKRSQIESLPANEGSPLSGPSRKNARDWRYFVVMRDFGKIGREAIVDPQHTAANIVDLIATREWEPDSIVFIHVVEGGIAADVTDEILTAAGVVHAREFA